MDLGEVRVGRRHARSRTIALAIAYLLPLLLLVVSVWVPHRVPVPGKTFNPATLSPLWWRPAVWLGLGLSVTAWFTAFIQGQMRMPALLAQSRLRVVGEALQLHNAKTNAMHSEIPLATVTSFMAPEDTTQVILRLANDEVVAIELHEARRARQLLSLLSKHVKQRTTRLPLGGLVEPGAKKHLSAHVGLAIGWLSAIVLLAQLQVGITEGWSHLKPVGLVLSLLLTLVGLACARLLMRRSIVIGSDGITIEGWSGRYVSYRDVSKVQLASECAVELQLRDGHALRVYEVPGSDDLLPLLLQALSDYRAGEQQPVELPKALQRGQRDAGTWQQALEHAERGAGYRQDALDVDRLARLLENPAASPDDRAAAAFLLARRGEPERVRITVEQTADIELRAVLEAAAEGELLASADAEASATLVR